MLCMFYEWNVFCIRLNYIKYEMASLSQQESQSVSESPAKQPSRTSSGIPSAYSYSSGGTYV